MQGDIEYVLFDGLEIRHRIDELAQQIANDYSGRDLTVVALLNGCLMFATDPIEQEETTRPACRRRLRWIPNRRRVRSRLRARFYGTLPQSSVYRRAEETIVGAIEQMKVRVQFYAQLRELIGMHELDFDVVEGATVRDVLDEIYARQPSLRAHDKSILVGAGLEFVDRSYELKPGEEIAIMPPVQGG